MQIPWHTAYVLALMQRHRSGHGAFSGPFARDVKKMNYREYMWS
jgi:hypothetical protein